MVTTIEYQINKYAKPKKYNENKLINVWNEYLLHKVNTLHHND